MLSLDNIGHYKDFRGVQKMININNIIMKSKNRGLFYSLFLESKNKICIKKNHNKGLNLKAYPQKLNFLELRK